MFKNKTKYVVGVAVRPNIYVIKMNRLKIEIHNLYRIIFIVIVTAEILS